MSKNYTFRDSLTIPVGNPTKKSDFDKAVENTKEINQRLEGIPYLGSFLPLAGNGTYSYDSKNRVSTLTLTGNPAGVITWVYDDTNGGRVNYKELVMTDPDSVTIRITYSYDSNNNITGITRTVS